MVGCYSFNEVEDSTMEFVGRLSTDPQTAFVGNFTCQFGAFHVDSKYDVRSPELPSYEDNIKYLEYLKRKATHTESSIKCLSTTLKELIEEEMLDSDDEEVYQDVKEFMNQDEFVQSNNIEDQNQGLLKKIKIEQSGQKDTHINDEQTVLSNILSILEIPELGRVATVCKKWTDNNIWQSAYVQRWGKIVHPKRLEAITNLNRSWREHCAMQYKWDNQQKEASTCNVEMFAEVIDYLIAKICNLDLDNKRAN